MIDRDTFQASKTRLLKISTTLAAVPFPLELSQRQRTGPTYKVLFCNVNTYEFEEYLCALLEDGRHQFSASTKLVEEGLLDWQESLYICVCLFSRRNGFAFSRKLDSESSIAKKLHGLLLDCYFLYVSKNILLYAFTFQKKVAQALWKTNCRYCKGCQLVRQCACMPSGCQIFQRLSCNSAVCFQLTIQSLCDHASGQ